LRTTATAFVGSAYTWGIQVGTSPNGCRRTNFSSSHPGGVQVLLVDGSVRSLPATMDLATLYFLSTPANSEVLDANF
jgi:prepilin-type processing-associated H-X9-DG protein